MKKTSEILICCCRGSQFGWFCIGLLLTVFVERLGTTRVMTNQNKNKEMDFNVQNSSKRFDTVNWLSTRRGYIAIQNARHLCYNRIR